MKLNTLFLPNYPYIPYIYTGQPRQTSPYLTLRSFLTTKPRITPLSPSFVDLPLLIVIYNSMARLSAVILFSLVVFAAFVSCLEGRKLLDLKQTEKRSIPALRDTLILSALPKGTVPASTPSKKGHAVVVGEKLIGRHLISTDRILRSVPSPGVGH